MRWIKRGFFALLATLIIAVLHYNLPSHDIVHIVGTSTKRIDFGENSFFWSGPESGAATDSVTRDVFFIETIRPNGKPMVYRNEDTGWGWPPYFKFNSYNLQATATSQVSPASAPQWVAVRHYGWRSEMFSIFPNALSIRPVSGPDETIIPWGALVILAVLAGLIIFIWRMLVRLRERMIDPMVDRVGDTIDELDARADAARGRAESRWSKFTSRFKK